MRLQPGTTLGHFEILGDIGFGAMGEVYRARDTKLGRDVALKVLPASVAADPERLARMRREAQMIATLNHPNIAQIHGIEDTGDVHALVLELVDGETLADRIARGPMALAEALIIAQQMAAALGAAHDAGVIHRDFKPANIKIKDDGTVKVLDFGLAKTSGPTGRHGSQGPKVLGSQGSEAPTLLGTEIPDAQAKATPDRSPIVSEHGMIVGTATYMAPEQAQGKDVDKRADIWAFGVILVEMVTGRRLFQRVSTQDTIAAVVSEPPNLDHVPAEIRKLVGQCLEKDPRKRLRDVGDAMSLVDYAAAQPAIDQSRSRWKWLWPAIAAVMALATAGVTWMLVKTPTPPTLAARFQIDAPTGNAFNYTYTGTAVSPDGKTIVFRLASEGRPPMLWARSLDSLTPRMLAGTENGDFPFWSADSKSIGFFAGAKLKRLDVVTDGARPIVLCDAADNDTMVTSGAWNKDDVILIGSPDGLYRVSATGGTPALVAPVVANQETGHGLPQFFADGERFIYFIRTTNPAAQGFYASALSNPGTKQLILATDRKAVVVSNEGGDSPFLLYLQDQTLLARRIDNGSLTFTGESLVVADGIAIFPVGFQASFWASAQGLLAYRTTASDRPRVTWVQPDNSRQAEAGAEDFITNVRLSPDATRAAFEITDGTGNRDIWVWNFARRSRTRVTFDPQPDRMPVWAPNGHEIAFGSIRSGVFQIYRKDVDSGQPEVALTSGPTHKAPTDWSRDGRYLLYVERNPTTGESMLALPMEGGPPIRIPRGPGFETNPSLSPDGKWMAFDVMSSGRPEVFVQKFDPGAAPTSPPGARWQISTQGGGRARWSSDGRQIFFIGLNESAILSAAIRVTAAGIEADPPRVFSEIPVILDARSPYDVATTGEKLLVLERTINQSAPLIVITNWMK